MKLYNAHGNIYLAFETDSTTHAHMVLRDKGHDDLQFNVNFLQLTAKFFFAPAKLIKDVVI